MIEATLRAIAAWCRWWGRTWFALCALFKRAPALAYPFRWLGVAAYHASVPFNIAGIRAGWIRKHGERA